MKDGHDTEETRMSEIKSELQSIGRAVKKAWLAIRKPKDILLRARSWISKDNVKHVGAVCIADAKTIRLEPRKWDTGAKIILVSTVVAFVSLFLRYSCRELSPEDMKWSLTTIPVFVALGKINMVCDGFTAGKAKYLACFLYPCYLVLTRRKMRYALLCSALPIIAVFWDFISVESREIGLCIFGASAIALFVGVLQHNPKGLKDCPQCGETIKGAALKCRHCGYMYGKETAQQTAGCVSPMHTDAGLETHKQ